ncbi:UPF0236 family transposase-like protein [Erysipelothrix aquatica]|uniref:UPF0236 family transposase-like protein n=1 Tax=Erysipelothrix aquatica TaxID=2683714 RepID=UPI0013580B54|nr:UPF0236 family protein [Erysipelothrix aquatica]
MDYYYLLNKFRAKQSLNLRIKAQREADRIDKKFYKNKKWRKQGYVCYGKRERTLLLKDGPITIYRNYYYNCKTRHGFYPVDDKYELSKSIRISAEVEAYIYDAYGNVKIEYLAKTLGVSKQTVYNVLNRLGMKEIRRSIAQNFTVDRIFIQADEDHVKTQKSSKRNSQIRMMVSYTDCVEECKGRNKLIDKNYILFMQGEDIDAKAEELLDFLSLKYPNCNQFVVGGDGGSWIQQVFNTFPRNKTKFVYDLFHLTQSLMRIFGGGKKGEILRTKALNYIEHDMKNDFKVLVEDWIDNADKRYTKKSIKYRRSEFRKILNFWNESRNNWLIDGYPGTSAEGHVSHFLSDLYSSRPKALSESRLPNYVRLQEYKLNGIDYETYREAPVRKPGESKFVIDGEIEDHYNYEISPYSGRTSNIPAFNHSTDTGFRTFLRTIATGSIT